MDTKNLDPLNQLDRVGGNLAGWWERQESKHAVLFGLRRAIGWISLPVFVAFITWMIGALVGVWPDSWSAYSSFWIAAWGLGVATCGGMIWGLRE